MKRAMLACLILALASGLDVRAAAPEELFKWGEYDSLIRVLEPVVTDPAYASGTSTGPDSQDHAKAYMFLGVAFMATHKPERADSLFMKAWALNPQLQLDRFYVSEAIADRFYAVAEEALRQRRNRTALQASRAMAAQPGTGGQARRDGGALRDRTGKPWLWWGLGVTAVAVAGGGAYWFSAKDEGPRENVTVIDLGGKK